MRDTYKKTAKRREYINTNAISPMLRHELLYYTIRPFNFPFNVMTRSVIIDQLKCRVYERTEK